jgi:hypothetical protein
MNLGICQKEMRAAIEYFNYDSCIKRQLMKVFKKALLHAVISILDRMGSSMFQSFTFRREQ